MMAICASCAPLHYTAEVTPEGVKRESLDYRPFGGSEALQTPGGFKYAGNRNASAKQFFQAATTMWSATVAFWTYRVGQLTTQMANAQAGSTARAQISADLSLAQSQLKEATKQQALQLGASSGSFSQVPFPTPH